MIVANFLEFSIWRKRRQKKCQILRPNLLKLSNSVFVYFNFVTNEVVQDWIKLIDLESRAEIKLIVILFRSESMTFLS